MTARAARRLATVGTSALLVGLVLALPTGATASVPMTTRVNVSSQGEQAEYSSQSFAPAVSGSGRYVAFDSSASNLVSGDTNGSYDVFVRDRVAGTTRRVSVSTDGVQGDRGSGLPEISRDGRFVVFSSDATNLVPGDTNNQHDVFVHDVATGTTERVNVGPYGEQANGYSQNPTISANGRFIAY